MLSEVPAAATDEASLTITVEAPTNLPAADLAPADVQAPTDALPPEVVEVLATDSLAEPVADPILDPAPPADQVPEPVAPAPLEPAGGDVGGPVEQVLADSPPALEEGPSGSLPAPLPAGDQPAEDSTAPEMARTDEAPTGDGGLAGQDGAGPTRADGEMRSPEGARPAAHAAAQPGEEESPASAANGATPSGTLPFPAAAGATSSVAKPAGAVGPSPTGSDAGQQRAATVYEPDVSTPAYADAGRAFAAMADVAATPVPTATATPVATATAGRVAGESFVRPDPITVVLNVLGPLEEAVRPLVEALPSQIPSLGEPGRSVAALGLAALGALGFYLRRLGRPRR